MAVASGGKNIFSVKDDELVIFRRHKIGFVFQFYNLVPVLNVYENVVLPLELDGYRLDRDYIEQILDTPYESGIDGYAIEIAEIISRIVYNKIIT